MGNASVSLQITELGLWPLIIILGLNLVFRRYGKKAVKKRMACLYQALGVFALTSMAALIVQRNLGDLYLYVGAIAMAILFYILRAKILPYRLSCPRCTAKLDIRTIYFMDNNLCQKCRDEENPETPG